MLLVLVGCAGPVPTGATFPGQFAEAWCEAAECRAGGGWSADARNACLADEGVLFPAADDPACPFDVDAATACLAAEEDALDVCQGHPAAMVTSSTATGGGAACGAVYVCPGPSSTTGRSTRSG